MKKEVVVVIAIIVVLLGAAGIMSWRQRIASPALTNNNYGLNQSVNAPTEPLSVDLTPATPEIRSIISSRSPIKDFTMA